MWLGRGHVNSSLYFKDTLEKQENIYYNCFSCTKMKKLMNFKGELDKKAP